jgi:hypothetical protein
MDDLSDLKEIEPPMNTDIIRKDHVEADVREKLKVYTDMNGKIDYLALVESGMDQYQVGGPSSTTSRAGTDRGRARGKNLN